MSRRQRHLPIAPSTPSDDAPTALAAEPEEAAPPSAPTEATVARPAPRAILLTSRAVDPARRLVRAALVAVDPHAVKVRF